MINIPRGSSGRVPDESGTATFVWDSVGSLAGDTSTVLRTLPFRLFHAGVGAIWPGSWLCAFQPSPVCSAAADGFRSGSRIIRKELASPSAPAMSGTSKANWRERFLA